MTCNDSAMASVTSGGMTSTSLTWEKLSPAEFQQLQDFAACKSLFAWKIRHYNSGGVYSRIHFIWTFSLLSSDQIAPTYYIVKPQHQKYKDIYLLYNPIHHKFGPEKIMTKYFAVFTLKNWYARSFTFLLIFHQNNSIWQEVTALWKKWLVCRPFPKTVILFTKRRILLSTAVTTLTHTVIDLTGFRFNLPSTF